MKRKAKFHEVAEIPAGKKPKLSTRNDHILSKHPTPPEHSNEGKSEDGNEALLRTREERTQYLDDSVDDYTPENHDSDDDARDSNDNVEDAPERTKKSITAKSKPKPARESPGKASKPLVNGKSPMSEETIFIIHARDNNLPDPFGTHSETSGKLPFAEVLRLWKEKFNAKAGVAAAEKRYRLGRPRYCEENPTYPREIIYMGVPEERFKTSKPKEAGPLKGQETGNEMQDFYHSSSFAGYNPHDRIRNAADIMHYFDKRKPIMEEERPKWLTIDIVNDDGKVKAHCDVPLRDIQRSSPAYARKLRDYVGATCEVEIVPKKTVERYIQCISPTQRSTLPDYDFGMEKFRDEDGSISYKPVCSQTVWDFKSFSLLYTVAALLEDSDTCNVVMDHWRDSLCKDIANQLTPTNGQREGQSTFVRILDFEKDDMNNLFANTATTDPVQKFWVNALRWKGDEIADRLSVEKDWDPTLLCKLDALWQSTKVDFPRTNNAEEFCTKYHHHRTKSQACRTAKTNNGWDTVDYDAIARRLLRVHLRKNNGCFRVSCLRSEHTAAQAQGIRPHRKGTEGRH
ncbi:hypothetical protein BCR34DRAFT_589046 [Clohesyomyces aquaticus]|uniref:Uncharacterized protein n=1 Tax=Clohesyomyces aquaticus TaxID=1231657 RepID=A0A1Y1ZHW5_9PLEO|nr:hypothetical protein BCR34DRAFT_589046 [Clohesyomyces aquaticus]